MSLNQIFVYFQASQGNVPAPASSAPTAALHPPGLMVGPPQNNQQPMNALQNLLANPGVVSGVSELSEISHATSQVPL